MVGLDMRPAICSICEKPSAYSDGGDWVKFKDYDEHVVTLLSHPVGLEYFSGAYIEEALALAHMNSCDAIRKIKENHCID